MEKDIGVIQKIFEKVVYESEEFSTFQKEIDAMVDERVLTLLHSRETDVEKIRNEINDIMYLTEKRIFELGLKYGLALSRESCAKLDDIDNL